MNQSGELCTEPLIPTSWQVYFLLSCDVFKERLSGPFLLPNQLNINCHLCWILSGCLIGRGEEDQQSLLPALECPWPVGKERMVWRHPFPVPNHRQTDVFTASPSYSIFCLPLGLMECLSASLPRRRLWTPWGQGASYLSPRFPASAQSLTRSCQLEAVFWKKEKPAPLCVFSQKRDWVVAREAAGAGRRWGRPWSIEKGRLCRGKWVRGCPWLWNSIIRAQTLEKP